MKNLKIFAVTFTFGAAVACGNPGPANTAFNANALPNSNAAASSPAAAAESPTDELAMGRSLYQQNCAGCHKEDGTGGKMTIEGKTIDPDDLSSEKIRKFDDAKISKYIYEGIEDEGMPAFKDLLSEAQIREIVRYVRVDVQKMSGGETAPPGAKK